MHSRKVQQRLNEKLWLAENYFRTHGGWRSSGPSQISQCSQNPSKSTNNALGLITATPPHTSASTPARHHPAMPAITARGRCRQPVHAPSYTRRSKAPSVFVPSPPVFPTPFLLNIRLTLIQADQLLAFHVSRGRCSHSFRRWHRYISGALFKSVAASWFSVLARCNIKSNGQFW